MKKILSFILSLIFVFSFAVTCFSVSLSKGTTKLNSQFKDGVLRGKLDYVYYSPVNEDSDTTKYPLLIWLHGKNSGQYKRSQLNNYKFSNWSSDEYQSQFDCGGCYLLAVRATTADDNSWSTDMCEDLYDTVQYFISLNTANIDMNRIYIAGYSTGGTMVWDMVSAYPDYFAAAMPLAAIFQPSEKTLSNIPDVSVWMFCSDNDYYPLSETDDVIPNYNYLKSVKSDKSKLRLTTFSEAVFADGTKKMNGTKVADEAEHYIWECFTFNMHMSDGVTPYLYSTTVDGYGNVIDFSDGSGIITWLDKQSKDDTNEISNGHISFITRIVMWFNSLVKVFRKMFRL